MCESFIITFQYLKGTSRDDEEGLFVRNCRDRTGSNGDKLKERLDMGKKFFTLRMVRHWNRLSGEVVAAPALAVLEARVDKALSNLV